MHLPPVEVYQQQIESHAATLNVSIKKRSNFGWLRLAVGVGILFLIYFLVLYTTWYIWLALAATIALFLYVVSTDANNNEAIANSERLLAINKNEVAILQGNYYDQEDGLNFLPVEHPYANDIDLFGHASIYQYVNRCTSEQSKQLLAFSLLNPSTKQTIIKRQEAAKSLSQHLVWRQQLQSSGIANPLTISTEQKIYAWLNMSPVLQPPFWKILPNIFTVLIFACLGAFLLDLIPSAVFSLLVFIFFLIAKYTSAKVHKTYMALSKIEGEVNTIQQQLQHVEVLPASSSFLNSYKKILLDGKGSKSIRELKGILQRFDFRLNVFVFIFLNTFLLWDVRQMNSLNKWKEKNAEAVHEWFTILANIEMLNTLAIATFNHPQWIFPLISDVHFALNGEDIGHPLITEKKRVNNSFSIDGTGQVSIITGSNMAGKSTFLRSIAVNLVLAQMGAPVCAKAFTFNLVKLYSSMRIADNLSENTSTFYAELKKLKSIIEEVKKHEKVFILLDEILRGTNSLDRHTGSEALVKQLIKENAVAVLATHDVELAGLEKDYIDAITNYHFDVQVEGEELFFDYKLKRGICQSMNASLLMKKIGIEM